MADLNLGAYSIRVVVPTLKATRVALPQTPSASVVPVVGSPGAPGVPGPPGGSQLDDAPDLTLIFENGLV